MLVPVAISIMYKMDIIRFKINFSLCFILQIFIFLGTCPVHIPLFITSVYFFNSFAIFFFFFFWGTLFSRNRHDVLSVSCLFFTLPLPFADPLPHHRHSPPDHGGRAGGRGQGPGLCDVPALAPGGRHPAGRVGSVLGHGGHIRGAPGGACQQTVCQVRETFISVKTSWFILYFNFTI